MAMVIDGADLVGAGISSFNPASFTAFAVVGPKAAIKVLFCLKEGKFFIKDLTPAGLKKVNEIHGKLAKKEI